MSLRQERLIRIMDIDIDSPKALRSQEILDNLTYTSREASDSRISPQLHVKTIRKFIDKVSIETLILPT